MPTLLYPSVNDCPTREVLSAFHQGKLPELESESLALHLSGCSYCEEVLRTLDQGDQLSSHYLKWVECSELFQEMGWQRMKTAAEALISDGVTTDLQHGKLVDHRLTGRTIGNYALLSRLGQGGMGVVYRAVQQPLNRKVALKVLLAGLHADAEERRRFIIEGMAAARLSHPNIVQILDFGEHEGMPYYSMELVEGPTLQQRLKQNNPFTAEEAARLVQVLAEAVDYCHRNQVLHRDLKPGNILLSSTGQPKISDFGLAKLLDSNTAQQTRSDALLGTPAYMAPEQAERRNKPLGPGVDIYGLGAILYTCLTGQPPFKGRTHLETLDLVRTSRPVPPSMIRADVPLELDAICLRCLNKSPAQRYPTAGALAADLGHWLSKEQLNYRPSILQQFNRVVQRRRRMVSGIALVTLLAMVLVVGTPYLGDLWSGASEKGEASSEFTPFVPEPWLINPNERVIGMEANPGEFRWREGASSSRYSLSEDKTLKIQSFALGLLELEPGFRSPHFRLRAQFRQLEAMTSSSAVGVYFTHTAHNDAKKKREVHSLMSWTFNDLLRVSPPPNLPGRPPLKVKKNAPSLQWQLVSDMDRRDYASTTLGLASGAVLSSSIGGPWRRLDVQLSKTHLRLGVDDQYVVKSLEELQKSINSSLDDMRKRSLNDPFLLELQPMITAGGGIGLYVQQGSASVRGVSLETLPEQP